MLHVVTWNLWGRNVPGTYSRDRGILRGAVADSPAASELDPTTVWRHRKRLLCAELSKVRADVVFLQECQALGTSSTAASLGSRLGMVAHEHPGAPGLAVLTKRPAAAINPVRLAAGTFGYPRPLHVSAFIGDRTVSLICAHLPTESAGPRLRLATDLAKWTAGSDVTILAGDLNAGPGSDVLDAVKAAGYVDATAASGATMPVPAPATRIDYVLVRAAVNWRAAGARALGLSPDRDGFFPSDHAGVVADLRIG